MVNSLIYLQVGFYLSIVMLAISMVIIASFVIPLQLKHIGVKNGLAMLRKQLMIRDILSFIIAGIAIFCLLSRFIFGSTDLARYVVVTAVFLFSLFILITAIIDSAIFHQQYTPDHIERAKRIQREMNEEEKQK